VGRERWPGLIVGLDVGSASVKVVVAERGADGEPAVIGIGTAPSAGIRRGLVVNLDEAAASITQALAEAELTAGVRIAAVHVAFAGAHLRSVNSRGVVAVSGALRRITRDDVDRAIEAARPQALAEGREILDAIPQEFAVDDQDEILDPVGMIGTRLEVNLHVITGSPASMLNLLECISRCGVTVTDTVVAHVAAAETVLTSDEKMLGAALVDVGAGTTSVAIFDRGALSHTAVLSTGGDQLTNDLAVGLRIPRAEAERLKRRHGRTFAVSIDEGEVLEVPAIAGSLPRKVPRKLVTEILAERAQAVLDAVAEEFRGGGWSERLTAGVVVTGGGASLRGFAETAEAILQCPVRRASPSMAGSVADLVNTPWFTTAAGVVICAARQQRSAAASVEPATRTRFADLAGRARGFLRVFHLTRAPRSG
jgi:cell division protein FtsA